jgi:predicted glycoside hydrolase/deacetylase ChbG (UPF0249 family)
MTRQLIVNADDYGGSPAISRGILHAHREGIVTSTTVMINQPGIEAQLAEALACPVLGVGQHLVFTAGRPLLPAGDVPALVDERGRFFDHHTLWARAEEIPVDQLGSELAAQVQRFAALAGHLPDHLDCHHFVHLYPPFFQVYTGLAARYRLPLRVPFPPQTDFERAARSLPYLEGFPPDLVRGMVATDSALLRARRLAHPDHFISTFFGRQALALPHLLSLLETLPQGISELMCHPGYHAAPSQATTTAAVTSDYGAERELELDLLTHPAVQQRVHELDIELVTYRALA